MTICLVGSLAALGIAPRTGAAGEAPEDIEEITVHERPIGEAQRRAPSAFVTDIDVPALAAPVETTADLLSQSAGIQVQRFGGLGAFSTISIRGSAANQVPIYIDGVPLSPAQDQTVNLSDLPLDSLERIEAYRGTVPVGFGGGGIGGVVNLVTRAPATEPRTELSAAAGSFATRKVVATHTRRVGDDHGLLAHVSYLGSEGDFEYFDDNGTPQNPSDDQTTTRRNNAFDSVDALLKTSHDLDGGFEADVLQEVFFRDQGVPGPGVAQFDDPALLHLRSLTYLRLRGTGLLDDRVDGDAKLFAVYNLQEFSDPAGDFGARVDTHNQSVSAGGNTSGTWRHTSWHAPAWFAELAWEQFFPYNETSDPKDGPDQERLRLSLSLQDEITLFDDLLTLVPSLRYDHLRDDFSGVDLANLPDSPPETTRRDLWSPAFGVAVRPTPWLTLRGNIGELQRPPSFSELFGNAGSVAGNAKLEPETAVNRDVGLVVEWPAPDRPPWLDVARLEYAYFHNDVRDLIAFELVRPGKFRAFNVGRVRVAGHELSLAAEVFEHLGVDANYTHQDSENRTVDSPEGNQLPLRPNEELFVRPRLFADWGSLYYELTFVGDNPTDADNFVVVPSRTIHTVGGTLQALPWLTARLELANLADADVRDLGDFPLPGLSVFGGITAVF